MTIAAGAPSCGALPSESELQLVFARLNLQHFRSALPAHRIRYNRRLSTVAGRIVYRARLIELSAPLLAAHPEALEATLAHEMIHAWLHLLRLPTGHGRHFKKKMRDVGLACIYHDLPVRRRRSKPSCTLVCPRCATRLLRCRRPASRVSCGRCSPERFDPRVEMIVRPLPGRRAPALDPGT